MEWEDAEEEMAACGREEGFAHGYRLGFEEGKALGDQHGDKMGQEIGFYAGFVDHLLKSQESISATHSKALEIARDIDSLVKGFPLGNSNASNIVDILGKIRSKFALLTKAMNVAVSYEAGGMDSRKSLEF